MSFKAEVERVQQDICSVGSHVIQLWMDSIAEVKGHTTDHSERHK